MGLLVLILTCTGVVPSPGWSNPILVTDLANTEHRSQFVHIDEWGRLHLIWSGFNNEDRIGYKMFAEDGTTLFPETMISRDAHSVYLRTMVMGDSLFAFWRESSPIYYAIRNLEDGSEITPATYLFTTSTMYPFIRTSPDSLGRLHALYNVGKDVYYAVWTPAPGSGFITEYEWKVEGADAGGVLLVEGNRVHLVVQDSLYHNYLYLQYDLEGNTTVPLTDFTTTTMQGTSRFPKLLLDSSGDLLVIEEAYNYPLEAIYMWKLDGGTGELLIEVHPLVVACLPEMGISDDFIVEPFSSHEQFYLTWCYNGPDYIHRIFNLVFDSDGNVLVDWHIAYNYDYEDPEDLIYIDGVTDETGNLYVVYSQVETEPQIDYFPTFGWFDHDYVSTARQHAAAFPGDGFSFSCNPVAGSVAVRTGSGTQTLRVYDITGREVSSIPVSDGTGIWHGMDFSGVRLPVGIYTVVGQSGFVHRLTLLGR